MLGGDELCSNRPISCSLAGVAPLRPPLSLTLERAALWRPSFGGFVYSVNAEPLTSRYTLSPFPD